MHSKGFFPVYFLLLYQSNFQSKWLLTMDALIWFSPVCDLWWSTKVFFCAKKDFPQWVHWYGCSPVCIFWCFTKVIFKAKGFSQWVHWYGYSQCVFSDDLIEYFLCKRLFTVGLGALIGFLTSVCSLVICQILSPRKRIFTVNACISIVYSEYVFSSDQPEYISV